jgi:hypothetical protein
MYRVITYGVPATLLIGLAPHAGVESAELVLLR